MISLPSRVLAIGGGGFMMEGGFSPIDAKILALTGRSRPRVCILPTPAGDAEELLGRFYRTYDPHCSAWQLTPFRKPTARTVPLRDITSSLLGFDAVFVSGGSTKSALGVWREWGIDLALQAAYQNGVLLSGMSAGAICWFRKGFTDSYNDGYETLECLGFLDGGCSPHHVANSPRAAALEAAVFAGSMPPTLAIQDNAAVLFQDGRPQTLFHWRQPASAFLVSRPKAAESADWREIEIPEEELT
jgi:dipeptidase E